MSQNDEENLKTAETIETNIEKPAVEPEPKLEQKETSKNCDEVKVMHDKEVNDRIEMIKKEGKDLEGVLKNNEANGIELVEYEDGEKKIEDEAKKEKEDYENSFRTPGDIESHIQTIADQENEKILSMEINFYGKDEQKCEPKKEHETGVREIIRVASEENNYYKKILNGEDVISSLDFKENEDNFFAPDEEKSIGVPLKNSETLKETAPIVRHETFHRAMRRRPSEWEKNMKEQIGDNIKEGKDTDLENLGLKIESGKFKKFTEDKKDKRSILVATDINFGKSNPATHLENDVEEILEEKLADEMMFKREKEIDSEKAVDNIIKAKIISLDNIAKNKGLNSYEEINPFERAGFKGFVANYYNTYRFLSRVSAEGGRKGDAEKFAQIADNGKEKMEDKISKMYENEEWKEVMKEKFGYTKEELLAEINEFLKNFD